LLFRDVALVSATHLDAPVVWSSRDLEASLAPFYARQGISAGILETLTGIRARRIGAPGATIAEAAEGVARAALSRAGIEPAAIGLLVSTSVCRDVIEPSTASTVHGRLGLAPTCLNFDVANACLGFLDGLSLAGRMIDAGEIEYALVVDAEDSRHVLEATIARLNESGDREALRTNLATLTLGSGAAAMAVGRASRHRDRPRLCGMVTRAATEHNHLCRGQHDRMETDSIGLLAAGVELGRQTFEAARAELGWTSDALDEVVLHQVSATHTDRVLDTLGIGRDRALRIYPDYGNVGPAAVPMAFSMGVEAGRIGPGARVGLMGIGSGLNCTMAEVSWKPI
jgi:3-oxoacyl-[acyl-carrier-protein] synthase III